MSTLTKWCQENHVSLNIGKNKELVVDFMRQSRESVKIMRPLKEFLKTTARPPPRSEDSEELKNKQF